MGKPRKPPARQVIALLSAVAEALQAVAAVLTYLRTCSLTMGKSVFTGWPPDHAESMIVTESVYKRHVAEAAPNPFPNLPHALDR